MYFMLTDSCYCILSSESC